MPASRDTSSSPLHAERGGFQPHNLSSAAGPLNHAARAFQNALEIRPLEFVERHQILRRPFERLLRYTTLELKVAYQQGD